MARVASHHLLPLRLRYLVLAEVETLRQSYRVRCLVVVTILLGRTDYPSRKFPALPTTSPWTDRLW